METNNKLREALATLVDIVDAWKDHLPPVIREGELAKAIKKAETALAEPVKNCEVGTAEEQLERWHVFCNQYDADCTDCPCGRNSYSLTYCFAKWAQMPYEEGGDK